jgi:hypothetical protein
MMTKPVLSMAVACAILFPACGSSFPPPNDEWAAAQADVGRAQASGSTEVPDARLHLQLAQEDLQKAKALIGNDNHRAFTLTEVARAEAVLALSIAQQSQADAQARTAQAELSKATTSH